MKYSPGKLLQLLGFVDAEPLRRDQRFLILKDPQARHATLHAILHALPACSHANLIPLSRRSKNQIVARQLACHRAGSLHAAVPSPLPRMGTVLPPPPPPLPCTGAPSRDRRALHVGGLGPGAGHAQEGAGSG